MKRTLSLIILLFFCIAFSLPAGAAVKTTDDKADVLNTLNILQGDETGDYKLEQQLRRSEAAAFIVRFIGKEEHVKAKKDQYKNTSFPDVESDMWHAPYVGFCTEEGIIGGYPDGSFRPDGYVSEKAFLKMVLCALGYEYEKDFTWDNVYRKAVEVGLVTDGARYQSDKDNESYIRSDVVKALYNALSKKNVKTGITAVEALVSSGAAERKDAVAAGLLKDEPVTAITQVSVSSSEEIRIVLNEEVKEISAENIQIYETQNTKSALEVKAISQSGREITVTTSEQGSEKGYTVALSDIEDMEGNVTGPITGEFTGYKKQVVGQPVDQTIQSDFFHIQKVEAVDMYTINVYFTQPININAEVPLFYSIKRDGDDFVKGDFSSMKLKMLPGVDNAVSIYLTNKYFLTGETYTLTISKDLMSNYGQTLGDGTGESFDFIGIGTGVTPLLVENVIVEDDKTVAVTFSKAVDPMSAQTVSNYAITNSSGIPLGILKSAVSIEDAGGRTVKLGLVQSLQPGQVYDVTVKANIYDIFKIEKVTEDKTSITGIDIVKDMSTITYVEAWDRSTLYVYSSRPLDKALASSNALYTVMGPGYSAVPVKAYYDQKENPYLVKLYLPAGKELQAGNTYSLRVTNSLKDFLNHAKSGITEVSFDGNDSAPMLPGLQEAKIIGPRAILVTLSSDIDNSPINTSKTNFTLEYMSGDQKKTETTASVSYINPTTLVIRFDSLDYTRDYTLKANMLRDYSGLHTATSSDPGLSVSVVMGEM